MCCLIQIAMLWAKKEYGITNAVISNKTKGKPYLTDYPNIHFNISHCKYGCICVISDFEVGVDIQDYRSITTDVINKVCCQQEKNHIMLSDNKEIAFTKIWAMKEAYLKMFGIGITNELNKTNTIALDYKVFCKEYDKYVVAVATEGEIENAKIQLDYAAEKHLELTEIL